MRADADLMVYVSARWPSLVREAVLLGCPPELAAEATTDALARCRRAWGKASREEDVDLLVRGELAKACARRTTNATSDRERQEQAEELVVLSPPSLELLRAEGRAMQARSAKLTAVVLVPILLVAAGLTWWTTGEDDAAQKPEPDLAPAVVIRAENPASGVTWYAGGQLHLDHVVLGIQGLRDMTRLGAGVVYGDVEGRVVYAADDGTRTVLGHKDPDQAVAATDETGWAAWVDTGQDRAVLVVAEATTGHVVARTGVGDGERAVAVDGDVVYLVGPEGARAVMPTGPASEVQVSPADLLDVRSRSRVFQVDPTTIRVVQAYFDVEFDLPGRGAALSPDGRLVLTRVGVGDDAELVTYDTRSGFNLPDGLQEQDVALAAAPGVDLTVSYVVAPRGLTQGEDLQLRTCDLRTSFCRIVARIPDTGSTPVLAR